MLLSLHDPSHAEQYKLAAGEHQDLSDRNELTRMFQALHHVSLQQYPVALYGREVGFRAFRITTSRSDSFQRGDWAVQFFFSTEDDGFHFSIWKDTTRGVLALPQRDCSSGDFEDAIDELIGQMVEGTLSVDSE